MSINRVNTGGESFNFLTNQSSILHTVDTNKITINGVNVIVDKPKRGDIMCITDKHEVIWIDGLSIEPKQLSKEFEPVGICLVVKRNKALVRYRQEKSMRWAASERWELPNSSIMNDGVGHTCTITLNGVVNPKRFLFMASSRAEFVEQLNTWFLDNDTDYSAELVELDTDLPAADTSDTKDGNRYRNRIIVNARFTSGWKPINIEGIGAGIRSIAKHIKNSSNLYYKNNGFTGSTGWCCRAKVYDYIQANQTAPTGPMTSIDKVSGGKLGGECPARLVDFNENDNCQILRDNFATYDEYLESKLIKFPCGSGGAITEFPSGKDNTYKLANCTFLNNAKGEQEVLYPGANWAASIDLNAPKLGKGNWWVPSPAEMLEMMREITYNTSFWETKPDIINSVLLKLTSINNSGWSKFSPLIDRWTLVKVSADSSYLYSAYFGNIKVNYLFDNRMFSAITIYEF